MVPLGRQRIRRRRGKPEILDEWNRECFSVGPLVHLLEQHRDLKAAMDGRRRGARVATITLLAYYAVWLVAVVVVIFVVGAGVAFPHLDVNDRSLVPKVQRFGNDRCRHLRLWVHSASPYVSVRMMNDAARPRAKLHFPQLAPCATH